MRTTSIKDQGAEQVAQDQPFSRLYRAVIFRAVQDLEQQEHQDEAREWLLSSESDYAFTTAGISPGEVRRQMSQTIAA